MAQHLARCAAGRRPQAGRSVPANLSQRGRSASADRQSTRASRRRLTRRRTARRSCSVRSRRTTSAYSRPARSRRAVADCDRCDARLPAGRRQRRRRVSRRRVAASRRRRSCSAVPGADRRPRCSAARLRRATSLVGAHRDCDDLRRAGRAAKRLAVRRVRRRADAVCDEQVRARRAP